MLSIPGISGFPTFRASDLAHNPNQLKLFSENDKKKILATTYGLICDYELIDADVQYTLIERYRDSETKEELLKIRITAPNKEFIRIMKVSEITVKD